MQKTGAELLLLIYLGAIYISNAGEYMAPKLPQKQNILLLEFFTCFNISQGIISFQLDKEYVQI